MPSELDPFVAAINLLCLEDTDFLRATLSQKSKIFSTVLNKNKKLPIFQTNPTLTKFFTAMGKFINDDLVSYLDPIHPPMETLFRKFLVLKSCIVGLKSDFDEKDSSTQRIYQVQIEAFGSSSLLQSLQFLKILLKETPKPDEILKLMPDMIPNLVETLKTFNEFKNTYDLENCKGTIESIKISLYEAIEALLCDDTLYVARQSISKNTIKNFFNLFEIPEDFFYFQKCCKILKSFGQCCQKENGLSILDYLKKSGFLLLVWRYINIFRQNNSKFQKKNGFLDCLRECFEALSAFPINFIDDNILQELILNLEVDILSEMLSLTDDTKLEACQYIEKATHTIGLLSRLPLKLYSNSASLTESSYSLSPNYKLDNSAQNTFFMKFLFNLLLKDMENKVSQMGWHFLLKETLKVLLDILVESLTIYNQIKAQLNPIKFCLDTLHSCDTNCSNYASSVIQFILTKCPEFEVEGDLETLCAFIRNVKNIQIYSCLIADLSKICSLGSDRLYALSKCSLFKILLEDVTAAIDNKSLLEYPDSCFETMVSILSTLLNYRKENTPLLLYNNCYQTLIKSIIKSKRPIADFLLKFIIQASKLEIQYFREHPITEFLFSCIKECINSLAAVSTISDSQLKLDDDNSKPVLKILQAIVQENFLKDSLCLKILIKKFQLSDILYILAIHELSGISKTNSNPSDPLQVFIVLDQFLKGSERIYKYFVDEFGGFRRIVFKAKAILQSDIPFESKNMILKKLLAFSLVQLEQEGTYASCSVDNLFSEPATQNDAKPYFICYPNLLVELYSNLVELCPTDQKGQYYKLLSRLLEKFPFNYTILNSCNFLEKWHQNVQVVYRGAQLNISVFPLMLKFLHNAPSLSNLRILGDYLNQQIIDTSLQNPEDLINSGSVSSEQSRKIVQELLKAVTAEEKRFDNLILSPNPYDSSFKALWIPHILSPQAYLNTPNNEKGPIAWNSFTIFSYATINLDTEPSVYPLCLVYFEIEKVFLKAFIQEESLIIKVDQLETLVWPGFKKALLQQAPKGKPSFCLGLSFNLNAQGESAGSVEIYLNGTLVTTLSISCMLFKNIYMVYGHLGDAQIIIGSWEGKTTLKVRPIGLGNFMLFNRQLNSQEIQELYMATSDHVESWTWWDSNISVPFGSASIKDFEFSTLLYRQNNSFPYSSGVSFQEQVSRKIDYSAILDSLIIYISPSKIRLLDIEDSTLKKNLIPFSQENLFLSKDDKRSLQNSTSKAIIPNMVALDSLKSSAIVIGNQLDDLTSLRKEYIHENMKKSLASLLKDSSILETLMACVLNKIKSINFVKSIFKIFEVLYRRSERIRLYLDQKEFLRSFVGVLETYTSNEEFEEMLEIIQGFVVRPIPKVISEVGDQKEAQHWILYSKNAFIKIFHGLDLLSRPGGKSKAYAIDLIKNKILNTDNFFQEFNITSLRSIKFPDMLIDGLILGKYSEIIDVIFDWISVIIRPSPHLETDFSTLRRLTQALDILSFNRIPKTLTIPEEEKSSSDTEARSKSEQKQSKIKVLENLGKKYMTLTQKDLNYAENLYHQIMQTLLILLKIGCIASGELHDNQNSKEIVLRTLLLNTLFKQVCNEKISKSIIDAIIQYLENKQSIFTISSNLNQTSDISNIPSRESSKSIWSIFGTNKSNTSTFKPATSSKKEDPETRSVYNYVKGLFLIYLHNIIRNYYSEDSSTYRILLIQTLDYLLLKERIILNNEFEEQSFVWCLLYLLFPLLYREDTAALKQKVLMLLCIIVSNSVEIFKKAVVFDKIPLFEEGFISLLKYKENPELIDIRDYTQFFEARKEVILKIINTRLSPEFLFFQEEVQKAMNLEIINPGLIYCLIPPDDSFYQHALLFPNLHGQIKSHQPPNIALVSFFRNRSFLDEKKFSTDLTGDPMKTGSQFIDPSPSVSKLNNWFERSLKPILHNNKKLKRNKVLRENIRMTNLQKYKKSLFLRSLFDLNDNNIETDNIIERDYDNYCWSIDSHDGPKGQRTQMKLVDIRTSKKQYQKEPLKEDSNKESSSSSSLQPEKLPELKIENVKVLISQYEDMDINPEPSEGASEAKSDINEDFIVFPKLQYQQSAGSEAGSYLQSQGKSNKYMKDSRYNSLNFLSNDEGQVDESLKEYSDIGSMNFLFDTSNIDLGIDDHINTTYNCLLVHLADKIQSVLILAKFNIYICLNFTLDENGEIIPYIDTGEEINHSQWILPSKPSVEEGVSSSDSSSKNEENSSKSTKFAVNPTLNQSNKIICISYKSLVELYAGRHLLKPCGIEIFTDNKKSYLIAVNIAFRNQILNEILLAHAKFFDPKLTSLDISLPADSTFFLILGGNPLSSKKSSKSSAESDPGSKRFHLYKGLYLANLAQTLWLEGEMSNFEYLSLLNLLSGRSFKDLSQYPVFPWVILEGKEETLKLRDPKNYRNLAKPMGSITEQREEIARHRYQELKEGFNDVPAHHYGSHYSSPGIVMYYFIRLFPFSRYAATLQGGHFDFADRLFTNLNHTLKLAMTIDYKELPSEFFTFPELLLNVNYFDFGKTQQKKIVDNVILPKWAYSDPRYLVCLLRRALESEVVTKSLNLWIDLIFGYKQKGKQAFEATNLYHVLTYEDTVDLNTTNISLQAILSQISEFGQCSRKLFFSEHPQRKSLPKNVSLFYSKENFQACVFRFISKLPSQTDKGRNSLRKKNIGDIKLKGEPNIDHIGYSHGLKSFQKTKSEINEMNYQTLTSNIMYNSFGFMFKGDSYKQVLNWYNFYNMLVLFCSESIGNKLWVFSDERLVNISAAYQSMGSNYLILGTSEGKLMIFSLEEKILSSRAVVPTEKESPIKEGNMLQSQKSYTPPNRFSSPHNGERGIYEIRFNIAVEFAIQGIEITKDSLKNKVWLSLRNKSKMRLEDFNDIEFRRGGSFENQDKSMSGTDGSDYIKEYSKFYQKEAKTFQRLKNQLIKEKKKSVSLKEKVSVLEAHEGKITKIMACNVWGIIITGDDRGVIKSWDINKGKLRLESFTYHFKDRELYKKSWFKGKGDKMFMEVVKKNIDREVIIDINICKDNGDLAILSENYVSIYTINHVLVSIMNVVDNQLPQLSCALLTRNCYNFEEDTLICGHKETIISFWALDKTQIKAEIFNKEAEYSNVMKGVFSHRYDKSIYANKIVTLNQMIRIQATSLCQAFPSIPRKTKVSTLTLTNDQTKLFIGLNNGEVYFLGKEIEEATSPTKSCNHCGNQIGVVDSKITCSLCQKIFCQNCIKSEEIVSFISLWKNTKLCPQCTNYWKNRPDNTLYDFY